MGGFGRGETPTQKEYSTLYCAKSLNDSMHKCTQIYNTPPSLPPHTHTHTIT